MWRVVLRNIGNEILAVARFFKKVCVNEVLYRPNIELRSIPVPGPRTRMEVGLTVAEISYSYSMIFYSRYLLRILVWQPMF